MTEIRDAFVVSCVTKRQKIAVDTYCWQNRISQSALVRDLLENFLSKTEANA